MEFDELVREFDKNFGSSALTKGISKHCKDLKYLDTKCKELELEAFTLLRTALADCETRNGEESDASYRRLKAKTLFEDLDKLYKRSCELSDEKALLADELYDSIDTRMKALEPRFLAAEAALRRQGTLDADNNIIAMPKVRKVPKVSKISKSGAVASPPEAKVQTHTKTGVGKVGRPPKRKAEEITQSQTEEESEDNADIEDDTEQASVARYCFCNDISYGEMVGCDNPGCPKEWFHFQCLGITSPPKGRWRCPLCRQHQT